MGSRASNHPLMSWGQGPLTCKGFYIFIFYMYLSLYYHFFIIFTLRWFASFCVIECTLCLYMNAFMYANLRESVAMAARLSYTYYFSCFMVNGKLRHAVFFLVLY